jgi:putative hemolysin
MIHHAAKRFREGFDHLTLTSKLVRTRLLRSYTAKVGIYFETDAYVVKTAESADEIDELLKLRHRVFLQELQGKRKLFRIDLDRHDLACDHLMILDRATGRAVGTYRLLSSHFFDEFYSEGEFELERVKALPGVKLELGRACIEPAHRNGMVIQLLWRGITAYMKRTETRYLFGCSSVQTLDPFTIRSTTFALRRFGPTEESLGIFPKKGYRPDEFGMDLTTESDTDPKPELPPLVLSYIRAGAKMAPTPAVDWDFGCVDFFTLLDRDALSPAYKRKFFGDSGETA